MQVVEAQKNKTLTHGAAFYEQYTKSIFVEGLTINVGDKMWMYWAARLTIHFYQFAQYAENLM